MGRKGPIKTMQNSSAPITPDDNAIPNAETVIERFGGIRPMATKMGVPVTTVQGWKKRNVIPGNRRADVVSAAAAHNVNLSGVLDAVSMATPAPQPQAQQQQPVRPVMHEQPTINLGADQDLDKFKRQAVRSAMLGSASLVMVFVLISGMLIAVGKQKLDQTSNRVATLERDVEAVQYTDPDKAAKIAKDLGDRINDLKSEAAGLQTRVADLKDQAEGIVDQIKAADVAGLMNRIYALEQQVQGIAGASPELSDMLSRLGDMQTTLEGQAQLQNSLTDLKTLVEGMQGRMGEMDSTLKEVQEGDSALAQTLQGVSPADLKAAALLLALTQVRESAAREQPFYDDLVLLKNMVGEDDPELAAAIDRLAPLAQQGVLSPEGLSNELRSLTGDIVVSSLKGEDVSVQDKAMARLHDVLKIQKDGQLVTGTDTQARVARAQVMLDNGDVEGALAELEALRGPAAQTAQPLIDQAQMTLMLENLQSTVTEGVMGHIGRARSMGGAIGGAVGDAVGAPTSGSTAPIMMPKQ